MVGLMGVEEKGAGFWCERVWEGVLEAGLAGENFEKWFGGKIIRPEMGENRIGSLTHNTH